MRKLTLGFSSWVSSRASGDSGDGVSFAIASFCDDVDDDVVGVASLEVGGSAGEIRS